MKYYYLDFNQTLFVILKKKKQKQNKKQTNKTTTTRTKQNKTNKTKQKTPCQLKAQLLEL